MVMSVADGSVGDGRRSRMAMVVAWIARFAEGGSRVSLSSCELASGPPSAVPSPGAEGEDGEAPGGIVARIEQWDSRKEDERRKSIMRESRRQRRTCNMVKRRFRRAWERDF
jgi:hypothetical protein